MIALVIAAWAGEPRVAPGPSEAPPLVFDVRAPMIALDEARWKRARNSTATFSAIAGMEFGAGMAGVLSGDPRLRSGGATLVVGGMIQGVQGWYQYDLARRRHRAFADDVAFLADRPGAWPAMAKSARLSAEREARSHAFATGLYSGFLGLGALAIVSGLSSNDETTGSAAVTSGVAFAAFSGIGFVHHASRWRAATRLSADLDTIGAAIPTPIPSP